MTALTETVTVEGDGLTVPLIVWRRFKRQMPGLVEEVYATNPGLADLGEVLPLGATFSLPIPPPREAERQDAIRLW